MNTYAPQAAQVTDTEPVLWFKAAEAFQVFSGVTNNGTPQSSPADVNDDQATNLMRAAYALQFLL